MKFDFTNRRVSGILAVLPQREMRFEDDMVLFDFPVEQSLRLKRVMGYDRHRIVDDGTCVSDLICRGLEHLFSEGHLTRDSIDALIVVTQSPDYLMPPTSFVVHGRLGLNRETVCLDLNQGCAGFVVGLIEAFSLLEQATIQRVVLANADILSRKTSRRDRNSYPLIGDGATLTLIEKSESPSIHAHLRCDGSRHETLMIPAGGMRRPCSEETAVLSKDAQGNWRAPDHLVMKGDAVFNFVQNEVPPLIREVLMDAGCKLEDIDYFLCHQPNQFMLEKLADQLGVPRSKMPSNIVAAYGNGSSITIPLTAAHNFSSELKQRELQVCLAGFGVGLTWGAMALPLGRLQFCDIIFH